MEQNRLGFSFSQMAMSLIVFLFLFVVCIAMSQAKAPTNLAMGKPYAVSPKPNYPLTAPSTDVTVLTDGKYTIGRFWTKKTTVGWIGVRDVEILIDLEKVSTIGGISFSTARGKGGGVYYPVHIFAFVGPDKEHLLYVGDIAASPQNEFVLYETKRFLLDDIGIKGRYVMLKIVAPKNGSFFCDEIEVFEGNQDRGKVGHLTFETARKLADLARWFGIENKDLSGLAEKITSNQPTHSDRIAKIKQDIITPLSMENVEEQEVYILKLRGESLRSQFPGKKLLLEAISPWTSLSPFSTPSGISLQRLSLSLPQGGYSHAAFIVTNLLSNSQQVSISPVKTPENAPKLALYQVPFVKSSALEYVADPLIPVKDGFILRSGESRMVLVTVCGRSPGEWQNSMKVAVGGDVTSIPVSTQVLKVEFPKVFTLNSVNWGYLDFMPIRDRKAEAVNDLFKHHTNVIVVPPAYLPLADPEKPIDFSRLENYLNLHRGASRVLFVMGYKDVSRLTVGGRYVYLDEKWKAGFRKWYKEALRAAAKAGFVEGQVYLYPYDEMGGGDIYQFIELARWAKKEIPGIRFYATLNNIQSLRVLPYLDIAQIVDRDPILREIKPGKTELWLYDANGPGKSLSPYSYYRMMSWKAFHLGFNGIGFWAYADARSRDNAGAWDDSKHKNTNYAVIYPGNDNTIVSSRRWEAWRMGIEDYELLTMYSKAKGDAAAKTLAKSVLDNPLDTTKADEVRQKILLELSK